MVKCVDKYEVREYVASKGLEYILIPCFGVYNSPDEVDWNLLPYKFAMKDTLGGGGNAVILITDYDAENSEDLKRRAQSWVNKDIRKKNSGREWPYYSGKRHRIIVEEYIDPGDSDGGLVDYIFFCFNGKVEFLYVMGDRFVGENVKVSIFDRDFKKLPVLRVGDEEFTKAKRPGNFSEMIEIAERLSEDFPHVRVDLYNVKGRIIFGEMTFFNASGYMEYKPDDFDEKIGKKWSLT